MRVLFSIALAIAFPAFGDGNPAATLAPDEFDAPAAVSVAEAQKAASGGAMDHGAMDHGAMDHSSHAAPAAAPSPATSHDDHASHDAHASHAKPAATPAPKVTAPKPAAKPTSKATRKATSKAAEIYACPMHPDVTSTKPGKCPKCGMTMVKRARK